MVVAVGVQGWVDGMKGMKLVEGKWVRELVRDEDEFWKLGKFPCGKESTSLGLIDFSF